MNYYCLYPLHGIDSKAKGTIQVDCVSEYQHQDGYWIDVAESIHSTECWAPGVYLLTFDGGINNGGLVFTVHEDGTITALGPQNKQNTTELLTSWPPRVRRS